MSVPSDRVAPTPPRPLLSRRAEERLGARHREVLDQLEALFLAEGFAGVSVRELAAHVGCSRRTLYELAPSKGELVLLVLDRFLQRVGRRALDAIDPSAPYAVQLHDYITGAVELSRLTEVFAEDLADEPPARRLFDRHFEYSRAVAEGIVRAGIAAGEFRPVVPGIVAGVLSSGALSFSRTGVLRATGLGFEAAVEVLVDLVIRSLVADDRTAASTTPVSRPAGARPSR